jgi:Ca-activated chloride channel family protein
MEMKLKISGQNLKWLLSLLFTTSLMVYGQGEKKFIREGNGKYKESKYAESEIAYRKAIDKNKMSSDAGFNLGDALYKQKKYEDAGKLFLDNSQVEVDNRRKSNSYYNLGNSMLNNNKIQESIDAYENSLKLNPYNTEAKYNLAYAQDLLKQQQKQNQKDQNKDNNKDQKKNDKNKNQDQNKKQDNKQNEKNNQNQKQNQQQKQSISKDDAQRLLDAIANDEKNVQEKVKLAKAAKSKVRTIINW